MVIKLHAGGVGRQTRYDGIDLKLFILVGLGWGFLSVAWPGFNFAPVSQYDWAPRDLHRRAAY